MDWTNIQQLQTLFEEMEALEDSASLQAPLSFEDRPIDRKDEQSRALAGYLMVCRQREDSTTYMSRLEHLLNNHTLTPITRQIILDEIQATESQLLFEHTRSLDALSGINVSNNMIQPPIPSTNTPCIQITPLAEADYQACFVYRLTHIRSVSTNEHNIPIEVECSTFLSTLSQILRIWQDRLSLTLDATFTWRYRSGDGHVVLDLITMLTGPEVEMVRTAAEGFINLLIYHLPLSEIFRFQPITEEDELNRVLRAERFRSVATLHKREETILTKTYDLYLVHTLGNIMYHMRDLLHYLVQSQGQSLVQVAIRPTRLTADEVTGIQDVISLQRGFAPEDMTFLVHPRQQEIVERYRQFLAGLQPDAYEVDITVASTTNADIMPLALLVGRTLLGVGGFEVTPSPYDPSPEASVSLDDVVYRTAAPAQLNRLHRLYTLTEATIVSRLPHPSQGGLPGMTPLMLRSLPLPTTLPAAGLVLGASVETRVSPTTIRLPYADRMRHVYMVGRTGTGKTTLLQNMVLQDIEQGHGVAVIDPHGDLTDALLDRIPPERAGDVIVFDPADVERPIGLNLLDVDGLIEKNMAVSDFIGLMYSMYDPHRQGIVGPRFEQAVRSAMQTAMSIKGSTLIDVLRIIADTTYSSAFRKHSKDVILENYWLKIFGNQSDFHRSEVLDYITSKFSRFVTDPLVRQIIGQPRTTLNLRQIMEDHKILVVNLSKGKLGEHNSHFIGFLLVSQLMVNFFHRAQMPAEERHPFYLYIDEFQNFATPSLATMLSEGRKYGVGLVLANQFMYQLPENVREAISGNIGTLCAFQVGLRDAEYIAREMYPVFDVNDMVNLPAYHVAIKMLSQGQTLTPFVFKTVAEHRGTIQGMREAILQHSRYRYGRSGGQIADDIRDQFEHDLDERLVGPGTFV